MPPEAFAIPLNAAFRFVHEPLDCAAKDHLQRFVGRDDELDELVARIILSDGGAFLLTGYRGVGKSTFVNRVIEDVRRQLPDFAAALGPTQLVDVHLNIPRAMESVELMYHVLRGLYLRLSALGLLHSLDSVLRRDLELAFSRTSRTIALKSSSGIESTVGVTLGAPLPAIAQSTSGIALGTKRTRGESHEIAYLAYDDKAAEYDLIEIARRLSRGFTEHRSWPRRALDRVRRVGPPLTRLKVLLIFDELDKIDDRTAPGSAIDAILANLKTLFTTSGIAFLFVAGKDIHERWLEDVGRGDSIYESVFSYALYLPPLWAHADPMCDPFLDSAAFQSVASGEAASAYAAFKKFLAFSGRGIPRRILRKFNERVRWAERQPRLMFSRDDVRQFRFFADLHDVMLNAQTTLVGELREESGGGRADRKRLGLYYLVDWILLRGVDEFTLQDAVAVSGKLSRLIAPADEAAPAIIGRLLGLLVDHKYLETISVQASSAPAPVADGPVRYRLTRKRLVEMGSLAGVVEQEAQAVIKESKSERFGGRYEIISIVGRGGMSTVYLAHDKTLSRQVALKEQLAALGDNPEARARFRREVEVLSRLQHENIVRIYDVDAQAKQPYIVMEYIEGVRLTDMIESGGLANENDTLRIARDIVQTVQYIHDCGVLWRDPKPGNVMITAQGRVVLLDFGISHIMAATEPDAGMLLGTPTYSSPEQLRGEPLDQRSDVYCLGIVLYQMATGRLPFDDASLASAYRRLLERPPAPSTFANVSPLFEAAILKCLETDKADRFESAAALLAALPQTTASQGLGAAAQEILKRGATVERREKQETKRLTLVGVVPALAPSASEPADIRASSLIAADGAVHELRPPRVRIGRSQQNDIVLADGEASRFHAELKLQPEGWTLADQNSRNSTLLNGTRMTAPVVLRDGDSMEIGRTILVFRVASSETPSAGQRVRRGDLFEFVDELRGLAPSAPLELVVERGLDRAIELARAERGFVMLADSEGQLTFVGARARGGVALPGRSFSTSRKIPEEVFRVGEIKVVADLIDGDLADVHQGTVALGIRHVLCVPLTAREESARVGVLYLDSRERGTIHSKSVHDALRVLAVELADIIQHSRAVNEARERSKLERELGMATSIQRALQPAADRVGEFYEVSCRMRTHSAVGGDFCHYRAGEDHRFGVVVGDVAGKGVGASLLASFLLGLCDTYATGDSSPAAALGAINQATLQRAPEARFATMFYALLSPDGTLEYCNGGHNPPVVVSDAGTIRLELGGPIVGILEGVNYEDATIELQPGDTVVVASDGITEALNDLSEEFGEARLVELVRNHRHKSAVDIANQVLAEATRFCADVGFGDDASVVVLRYRGADSV